MKDKSKWIVRLAVVAVLLLSLMVLLVVFSAQDGPTTYKIVDPIRENIRTWLYSFLPSGMADFFADNIRKFTHVFLYGVLGVLGALFFLTFDLPKKWLYYVLPFALCLLFAISDEIHQMFVYDRTASAIDVLIDSAGFCVTIFIVDLIAWKVSKGREKKKTITPEK